MNEQEAEENLNRALHDYLRATGKTSDGEIVTGWGVVMASTITDDDGDHMYRTQSFQNPGGLPTYTWIGMLNVETRRWMDYVSETDVE